MKGDAGFVLLAVFLAVALFPEETGEKIGKILTAIESRGQEPTAPTPTYPMERPAND